MDIIDVLILGPGMYGFLVVLAVITLPVALFLLAIREGKPHRHFDQLMKNPKFAEEQKNKFIKIDEKSNQITLKNFPGNNDEEWIITKEKIIIENCSLKKKDVTIPFYKISKLTLLKTHRNIVWGDIGTMHIWLVKPAKWKTLPFLRLITANKVLYFKPFYENEVLEVKRRYDEYQTKKGMMNNGYN